MRLLTIWTVPAMALIERFRRTGDWLARQTAAHLPARVRYWTFIQVGANAILPNEVIPEVKFVDLLDRATEVG